MTGHAAVNPLNRIGLETAIVIIVMVVLLVGASYLLGAFLT